MMIVFHIDHFPEHTRIIWRCRVKRLFQWCLLASNTCSLPLCLELLLLEPQPFLCCCCALLLFFRVAGAGASFCRHPTDHQRTTYYFWTCCCCHLLAKCRASCQLLPIPKSWNFDRHKPKNCWHLIPIRILLPRFPKFGVVNCTCDCSH